MKFRSFLPGFQCSEVSLGTLGLAGGYGSFNVNESIRTIRTAVDLGINLIDTADIYGRGLGEELIGEALSPSSNVLVVTKVGRDWYHGSNQRSWDPQYLSFAVHNSLRRLRRPAIDVCLLHNPDLATIQRGEAFATMNALKRKGDIRHWGVSITTAEEGMATSSCPDLEVIQFYANIAEPELLATLLPILDPSKIGIMVRMPLGGGLLTGKYGLNHQFEEDDYRYLRGESWVRGMIQYGQTELDSEHLTDRVRIALEYVLANRSVSTVICGMRTPRQVEENILALYGSKVV